MIGVAGNRSRMPQDYPLGTAENAGNMIHARAPLRILPNTVDYFTDRWASSGASSFADFVNRHCSHLIITMANSVWVNSGSRPSRYTRFKQMLELYDVPIIIFGVGVRSDTEDLSQASLPPEAIDMLRYMEQRCGTIGVRGPFTKKVFAELAGVTDVVVTGCPSLFSEPKAFKRLRRNLENRRSGPFAFAGTNYARATDLQHLATTVRSGGYYLETTNADIHRAHLQALRGERVDIPDVLAPAMKDEASRRRWPARRSDDGHALTREQLEDFLRSRYRLFRDPEDWLRFNREVVSYTYGTRFHVNMASLLAGVPATWITHDSRTRELCDFFHLPHVDVADAQDMEPADFQEAGRYEALFDNLPRLFGNWASYLNSHGLDYEVPTDLV